MPNVGDAWLEVFGGLEKFRGRWPSTEWSYDHRLRCVTSVIDAGQAAAARALIGEVLSTEYTAKSIAEAPEGVRAVADRVGEAEAHAVADDRRCAPTR